MEHIPNEFLCPITLTIMQDPILMPDGQSYERNAIEAALALSPKSPITQQPMTMEDGIPNTSLLARIQEYQAQHQPITNQILSSNEIKIDSFGATIQQDPENPNNDLLHIHILPHEVQQRNPLNLIAMVDISSSMKTLAQIRDVESLLLTRLQLVKHALKTIVATLTEIDSITLISFCSKAQVVLPHTKLNKEGRNAVHFYIENLVPHAGTNIWEALQLGIDSATAFENENNVSLLLFTDGEPNKNPPNGIIPTLAEYVSGKPMNYTISTFGFGYQLDSKLLEGIAKIGNGIYGYCPDCTMVGTIFINYMSNILCKLTLSNLIIKGPAIDLKMKCDLYNGSARNYLFSLPKETIAQTQYCVQLPNSEDIIQGTPPVPCSNEKEQILLRNQLWRKKLLNILESSLTTNTMSIQTASEEIEKLFNQLTQEQEPTLWMKKLMMDLVSESPNYGQVSKAYSPQYFPKWGESYLRSFMRFHLLEQCGNFKDESLQLYSGPQFMNYRQIANRLFCEIPPPKPKSIYVKRFAKHSSETNMNARYSLMSSINTRYSGCFGGLSYVSMYDHSFKKVKDLQKGDRLVNGSYIECVVKIHNNAISQSVTINGAIFTPWHPIKIDGNWVFPSDVAPIELIYVDAWYNLVLKDRNQRIVEINGIEAVTLGHGMKGNVVEHPYFGSETPINALKAIDGYHHGYVEIENREPIRDSTGLVVQYF